MKKKRELIHREPDDLHVHVYPVQVFVYVLLKTTCVCDLRTYILYSDIVSDQLICDLYMTTICRHDHCQHYLLYM